MPNINGIEVEFPHNPYKVQLEFMNKMITAIQNSQNSVLESPTGTGKTLSLLCSSLACIQTQKLKMDDFLRRLSDGSNIEIPSEPPWMSKIIFTSRTHSQLKQAMKELKSTVYKRMNTAVLGSRQQLCINSEVQKTGENMSAICKSTVKRKKCEFYNHLGVLQSDTTFMDNEITGHVLDIEDLVSLGKEKKFCPYYMSEHMARNADIVFSPYNYVLNERIRMANETLVSITTNGTIIFDEAHNIPQFCEDVGSIEFDSDDIIKVLADVEYVAALLRQLNVQSHELDFSESDVQDLKGFAQGFQAAIDDQIVILNPLCGVEFHGDFIFTLMEKSNITFHVARKIFLLIENIIEFLADNHRLSHCGEGLRKFKEILWVPFSDSGEEFWKNVRTHYRVYAEFKKDEDSKIIVPHVKMYYFWCFTAKFVLEKLVKQMNTRSLTFTSGTMSPFGPFVDSLCIAVNITLQCNHIVAESQVLVEVVSAGSDGERLDSSFRNRFVPEYITSLGRTILSLCRVIPDGILIFFTSYKAVNLCRESWDASGLWSQIQSEKPIFIEPQLKREFLDSMNNYYANINDPRTNGAIFIGVCRGKIAEGLDFADRNGRAVVMTGIPFPPWKLPKVQIKMKYLDDIGGGTTGQEWYALEASRAVNQAVGRIIRHKNDFGGILLLDCRFHRQKNQLSGWLQKHVNRTKTFQNFGSLMASIVQFFQRNQTPPDEVPSTSNRENDPLPLVRGMDASMERILDVPMSAIEYNLLYENML